MADTNGEADIWMNACRHDDPAIKVTAFVLKDLSYDLLIGTESLIRLGLLAKGWPNVRPRSMEREEEREKPRRRESGWMTREDGVMTDAAKCTEPSPHSSPHTATHPSPILTTRRRTRTDS